MKADNLSTHHNRTIKLTDIPGELDELTINITYHHPSEQAHNQPSRVLKAITLDKIIIPHLIKLINQDKSFPITDPNDAHAGSLGTFWPGDDAGELKSRDE